MTLPTRTKDNEHSHTSEITYFMSGGSAHISMPDSESIAANIPGGHVMTHESWTHTVANTGSKDIRAVIFERK